MVGKVLASGLLVIGLAAPAFAQEAAIPQARKETCLEVKFEGDYNIKIPCPHGTRSLLEKLPRPTDPVPRRDLAIDPEWPHDQAMATEPDWPHDGAMIAPLGGDVEQAVPLFDKLLGALESDVRESKVRQLLEDWLPGTSN